MRLERVRGRRLGIAFILVGGLTCLVVGTVLVLAPADAEVRFDDLVVGQCLQELEQGGQARSVRVGSCDEPHAAELFATFDLEGEGEFPGAQQVGRLAEDGCTERLAEREDPIDLDRYAVTTVTPTAQSWAAGDRDVQCLLGSRDGSPLTGSLLESDGT